MSQHFRHLEVWSFRAASYAAQPLSWGHLHRAWLGHLLLVCLHRKDQTPACMPRSCPAGPRSPEQLLFPLGGRRQAAMKQSCRLVPDSVPCLFHTCPTSAIVLLLCSRRPVAWRTVLRVDFRSSQAVPKLQSAPCGSRQHSTGYTSLCLGCLTDSLPFLIHAHMSAPTGSVRTRAHNCISRSPRKTSGQTTRLLPVWTEGSLYRSIPQVRGF